MICGVQESVVGWVVGVVLLRFGFRCWPIFLVVQLNCGVLLRFVVRMEPIILDVFVVLYMLGMLFCCLCPEFR